MAALPETIRAALEKRVVKKALLARFDFASGVMRVWGGHGRLAAAGQEWSGLGELGSVSGIELPAGGTSPEGKLTLSGVDPALVATALGSQADWKGRFVALMLQHFDETYALLDAPVALYLGRLDKMAIRTSGATRVIEVTAVWHFARRAVPPFTELTDADQQARFPGDKFCEFVPRMQNFQDKWPAR